jgi:excisionase family DNA binding protein
MPVNCHPEAPDPRGAIRPGKAAELLDCSRAKIYQLIADGELRSFKIGRGRRILLADLDAYIARQAAREAEAS